MLFPDMPVKAPSLNASRHLDELAPRMHAIVAWQMSAVHIS